METFLVGGAVRDTLLGMKVKDRDWLVVGSTPEELLDLGYTQVGSGFPVFLHPQTREEYALARTERKSGHGYTGFQVAFGKEVTLEEDLARRDLTINAMAQTDSGEVIDPFGGQKDLANKTLRHVTNAFKEDPLRVLRVARFAARFEHLGFEVAEETLQLMRKISVSGELQHLPAERIWQEMSRALLEPTPSEFFLVLKQVSALGSIFPALDKLFGVPQPMRWHPEIDTGIHTLKALDSARKETDELTILFAVLCHDLGKGLTPKAMLPSHRGHEAVGADLIKELAHEYRWPSALSNFAEKVARYHTHCHRLGSLKPTTIIKLFKNLDAYRQPNTVSDFALACRFDYLGRSGFETLDYPQADELLKLFELTQPITAHQFIEQGKTGKQIGEAIDQARAQIIARYRKQQGS